MSGNQLDPPRGPPAATCPDDGVPEGAVCLVAVDGSNSSTPALGWALRHALDHGMRVEVLTIWPPSRSPLIHEVPGHFCLPRWNARTAQQTVVRHALKAVPAEAILSSRLENGDVAEGIVRASARCELVVLGSGSGDGCQRLTARIRAEATCAVVVIDDRGRVSAATTTSRGPTTTHH